MTRITVTLHDDGRSFTVDYCGIVGTIERPASYRGHPDDWTPDESEDIEGEGTVTGVMSGGLPEYDEPPPEALLGDVTNAVMAAWGAR